MNMPASENLQSHLNMTNLCLESSKSWLEIFLATISLAHHQYCLPLLFMEESMILSISLSWHISSLEDASIVASFWLPWTIPQAEKYLLNIAANYILYKMQEFFYFHHKFVMFYGNLSGEKG